MTKPSAGTPLTLALAKHRAHLLAEIKFVEARYPNSISAVRPYIETLLSLERLRLDLDDLETVRGEERASTIRKFWRAV